MTPMIWLLIWLIAAALIILFQLRMIRNLTKEVNRLYSQERVRSHYDEAGSEYHKTLGRYMEIANEERVH